jgi:hypothetical protein
LATSLLEDHLARSLDGDDLGEAIRTIANLFESDLVSEERGEELLELGDELIPAVDQEGGTLYLLAAEHFCRGRFIAARDAGRAEDADHWMERTRVYSGVDSGDEALDLSKLASLASQYHMAGDDENAADCYRRIVEETGLDDYAPVQEFALQEAGLRVGLGDYERAVEVLTQLLPLVEARYLTAVLEDDVADAEQRLVETVDVLARAEAERGHWDEVVRTLDRSSGLRLRYRAALRERGDTASIMTLERELDAATRGAAPSEVVEDEQALSARARLLEEYRRLRAALPADRMDSPSIADLAGVLAPDEALAVVATTYDFMLIAVVAWQESEASATGVVDYDWNHDELMVRLARDGDNGWVSALLDAEPRDPAEALAWLLAQLDDGPVKRIRELLPPGVRRLTLIPHDLLNLIPWWAAGGFEGIQVVIGPSASEVVRVRKTEETPARRSALMIANPTLDLAATGLGCASAAAHLGEAGFDVTLISRHEATEPRFLAALEGRSVLNFAGHGRLERRRSALELNPGPLPDPDPLTGWAESVSKWREVELVLDDDEAVDPDEAPYLPSERWADLEGVGRLYERRTPGGPFERFLERRDGTLAATYAGDTLVRVAELWSASDIVVGDRMRSCRLAVLCACQAGAGAGRGDETPGFPAAFALAGVDTVIGSLWRVEEPYAALWVVLFYEALAEALEDERELEVDVARLVRDVADRLRAMDRPAAEARLTALIDQSDNPLVRLELEAYSELMGERPFADAWRWAAFYVAGRPTITFEAKVG